MKLGHSLARKITNVVLLATALALTTIVAALLVLDRSSSLSLLHSHLNTLSEVTAQNSAAALLFRDKNAAAEILQALQSEKGIVAACLYDQNGTLFASYKKSGERPLCPATVAQIPASGGGYITVVSSSLRNNESAGTVFLASDIDDLRRRRQQILIISSGLLALALAMGGVAGGLLQRRITQPISELADAMDRVTQSQDYKARVHPRGSQEIAQLGATFNTMLSELQRREYEKSEAEAKLQYQALNDVLTGLPNRRLLADRLTHGLAQASRSGTMTAVLYIDLDGFKLVNDTMGHAIGDLLLAEVAKRLDARVRKSDTLARLGGDEFIVLLANLFNAEEAGAIARALLAAVGMPFSIQGHEINISASIGISLYPADTTEPGRLLEQADSAMYVAKRGGKNQLKYYTPEIGSAVQERVHLEAELRGAMQRGEIILHYQPEFEIATNEVVRFEALARWAHPTLGLISPAKFIPVAEESGLIVPLGAYLMERACADASKWQQEGAGSIQVAVNVSSIQFLRDDFVGKVMEILSRTGLDPRLLQLEITESVMLGGLPNCIKKIKQLKQLGVTLAVDDFGTGYSSLGYLPRLPFDALKIDQSFIHGAVEKAEKRVMLESMIALARKLHMRVIAEGVETQDQLELLKQLGAHEVQGYLLGRPDSDTAAYLHKEPVSAEASGSLDLCRA